MTVDEMPTSKVRRPTVSEVRTAESKRFAAAVFRWSLPVVRQLVFAGGLGLWMGGCAAGMGRPDGPSELIGWGAVMVGLCIPLRRGTWRNR